MARYYLQLHENGDCIEDLEGCECNTPEGARAIALDAARDVMAEGVRAGRLCLKCHIAIEDADHRLLIMVPFSEAVEINSW